ncbi:MAG: SRPBCC domain-containing protein [Actinophytocola sp.]|uniref:SRPBCC domain-containing protein n=1 Tax=Actinophytocola sp. TaxID=1872138 RepID=UPI003C73B7DE
MGDRDIVITREFAAPRQRVFDAHTRPELLMRWFGPHDWRLVVCEVDLREGGTWHYVLRGPGGAEMTLGGTYLEIEPPNRLVMTETNPDCHARAEHDSVITIELAGDTVLTHTATFPTREIRDAVMESGMARGVGQGFDRLAAELEHTMDWTIEMIPVPVTDVDRAKDFYANKLGFTVDVDHEAGEFRFVQLTPPGSGCSIGFGHGISEMKPGDLKGVQLVVDDVQRARDELVGRGVDATPVYHFEDGKQAEGPGGTWNSFVSLSDPDGNRWVLQERPAPER